MGVFAIVVCYKLSVMIKKAKARTMQETKNNAAPPAIYVLSSPKAVIMVRNAAMAIKRKTVASQAKNLANLRLIDCVILLAVCWLFVK